MRFMQKKFIIGLATLVIFGGLILIFSGKNEPVPQDETASTQETAPKFEVSGTVVTNPKPITMANGLIIEDTKIGDGEEAKAGMLVAVHYVGTLTDGKKFDSSRDRGQPFVFQLGVGQVIAGWDQGFEGMKVGGVRKLTIPSELGYGAAGAGSMIPPNATLLFEVELLGVKAQ